MLCLSACTARSDDTDKAADITGTILKKSLLEQAVDWSNSNLFDDKKEYKIFTLEQKTTKDKEYDFLIKQEPGGDSCELYYIRSEEGQVKSVIPCGGGEKPLFSYDIVKIHGEDYAEVYCVNKMYEGNLELYPVNDNGSVYIIEDAIDYNREVVTINEQDGFSYTKSQIYSGGKLKAEYRDLTYDIYTDIRMTGYIYEYIQYPWDDYPMLTNIEKCTRTYYFDDKLMQFVFKDENTGPMYSRYPTCLGYTGYMDVQPGLAKNNPKIDYDGDGLLDRVYKEVNIYNQDSSFYVYFGNGKKLLLADHAYGFLYKTIAADLTGDGMNEIIFEQYSSSTKSANLYYSIFTFTDGNYERMDIPYFRENYDTKEEDGMLFLPLVMNKVDSAKVSIYQPDSGYQGYITTVTRTWGDGESDDEMVHLYCEELEGQVTDCQASEMQLIDTEQSGKKAFLLRSYLGDKWCSKSIDWKLEYVSGEWRITGVYQADPIRVEVGTEYTADLDGDKANDDIYYRTRMVMENDYEYEVPVLRINGTEYDYKYLQEKFGVFIINCSHVGYYFIDIDTTDNYREIAILDEGPSSDPVTHFFRYTGSELEYCGAVTDFPDSNTFFNEGNAKLAARKRLDILQTWWALATWKLNDKSMLEEEKQEIYYALQPPEPDESTTNYAKSDLILFQNPDMNSDSVTIHKGEIIRLTATDNRNWIQITSESGINGWFYLEAFKIILPTGEGKVGDIVTHLNMAD
jgi:hypothetical protein